MPRLMTGPQISLIGDSFKVVEWRKYNKFVYVLRPFGGFFLYGSWEAGHSFEIASQGVRSFPSPPISTPY